MKVTPQCYQCLENLIENAVELATEDIKLRENAGKGARQILESRFSPVSISVDVATYIHDYIKDTTGNPDPYRHLKKREIELARDLYHRVKHLYQDGFHGSLRLAVLGNAMDFFRPLEDMDPSEINNSIELAIDHSELLLDRVQNAKKILYLADNSGEQYFDLPMVNLLKTYSHVSYVVKARPVQNDVTHDDLRFTGLDKEIDVIINTGTATPGIVMSHASDEFIREYNSADLIFAKGMGYYESLSEFPEDDRVFYCFKAKCKPVADSLGVPVESFVLIHL